MPVSVLLARRGTTQQPLPRPKQRLDGRGKGAPWLVKLRKGAVARNKDRQRELLVRGETYATKVGHRLRGSESARKGLGSDTMVQCKANSGK